MHDAIRNTQYAIDSGGSLDDACRHTISSLLAASILMTWLIGDRSGIKVTKELAEAIWLLTWGYPYSIRSLISSKCSALQNYPDLSALGEVFLFELTNPDGKLWGHYNEEFGKACPDFGAGLSNS